MVVLCNCCVCKDDTLYLMSWCNNGRRHDIAMYLYTRIDEDEDEDEDVLPWSNDRDGNDGDDCTSLTFKCLMAGV